MIKVLISGVGSDVAQGVIKCLNESELELKIYKIGASPQDSWLYLDELSYLSPKVVEPGYVDYICNFISNHKIDVFMPCIDSEIKMISENKTLIENTTGASVFVGDLHNIEICDDKLKTSNFLRENGFSYPKTWPSDKLPPNTQLPLILKTRKGCGSRDIQKIVNYNQLSSLLNSEEYILQEYLEGDEYTAGIYLGDDGEVKGNCIFKRKLKDGSTYQAESVIDEHMENYLNRIAKQLGLKYVNIQFRLKDGLPCPFEFNGRFSGTTGMIRRVFNAPDMMLREIVLKLNLTKSSNKEKFYVMRHYNEIYASEEDVRLLVNRSKND